MDPETLEAIKCCPGPWDLSGEEYDFWEEWEAACPRLLHCGE